MIKDGGTTIAGLTYTHPTNGANTTIAAANGLVLSAITVNNLGHVTSVGSKTLAAVDIPALDAAKITTGTFDVARIPNLDTAKIATGTLSADRIPVLPIDTKTSGTLAVGRGGTGATTHTSGNVLIGSGTGAITSLSRSGIDTRSTFPAAAHALGSHSDVTITSVATDNLLQYNGTAWVNAGEINCGTY